jgi:hypothetical protein
VIGSISVGLPIVWRYSYAVSPDGKRIAVMADQDVRIYETSALGCGD